MRRNIPRTMIFFMSTAHTPAAAARTGLSLFVRTGFLPVNWPVRARFLISTPTPSGVTVSPQPHWRRSSQGIHRMHQRRVRLACLASRRTAQAALTCAVLAPQDPRSVPLLAFSLRTHSAR